MEVRLPELQTAAIVRNPGPEARFVTTKLAIPEVGNDQVLIELEIAGLCHSDLNRVYGDLPLISNIVGHEGVGRVVKVGSPTDAYLLGQRIGVGWLSQACLACEVCQVDYTSCPKQKNLGRDLPGTFQQYLCVNANFVHPIPDGVPSHVAAPLLCAGITMFSALRKASIKPGSWLVIFGAGGGLGHLGVQIASAEGYKVIAVDSGDDKRQLCTRFGAVAFVDFLTQDVKEKVATLTNGLGAHAVICAAGSKAAYKQSIESVRNAGTVVCVGVNPLEIPVTALDMVRRGLRLVGSAVGSRAEVQELMRLAADGKVEPLVEIAEFRALDDVARSLEKGQIAGRVVVKLPQVERQIS